MLYVYGQHHKDADLDSL